MNNDRDLALSTFVITLLVASIVVFLNIVGCAKNELLAGHFSHNILVALLTMPWAYRMLAYRTFYPAQGIMAVNLTFNCQLQYYYPPEQQVNTLVLTCPGIEMMRLRPFKQPWFEDW